MHRGTTADFACRSRAWCGTARAAQQGAADRRSGQPGGARQPGPRHIAQPLAGRTRPPDGVRNCRHVRASSTRCMPSLRLSAHSAHLLRAAAPRRDGARQARRSAPRRVHYQCRAAGLGVLAMRTTLVRFPGSDASEDGCHAGGTCLAAVRATDPRAAASRRWTSGARLAGDDEDAHFAGWRGILVGTSRSGAEAVSAMPRGSRCGDWRRSRDAPRSSRGSGRAALLPRYGSSWWRGAELGHGRRYLGHACSRSHSRRDCSLGRGASRALEALASSPDGAGCRASGDNVGCVAPGWQRESASDQWRAHARRSGPACLPVRAKGTQTVLLGCTRCARCRLTRAC